MKKYLLSLAFAAIGFANLIFGASAPAGIPAGFPEHSRITGYFFYDTGKEGKEKYDAPYKFGKKNIGVMSENPIENQITWLGLYEKLSQDQTAVVANSLRMLIMAYINQVLNIKFIKEIPDFLKYTKVNGAYFYKYVDKLRKDSRLEDLDSHGHILSFINNLFDSVIHNLLDAKLDNGPKILQLNLALNVIERVTFAFFYDNETDLIIVNYEDRFKKFVTEATKPSSILSTAVNVLRQATVGVDLFNIVTPGGTIFEQLKTLFNIDKSNYAVLNTFMNDLKNIIGNIGVDANKLKQSSEQATKEAEEKRRQAELKAREVEEALETLRANTLAEEAGHAITRQSMEDAETAAALAQVEIDTQKPSTGENNVSVKLADESFDSGEEVFLTPQSSPQPSPRPTPAPREPKTTNLQTQQQSPAVKPRPANTFSAKQEDLVNLTVSLGVLSPQIGATESSMITKVRTLGGQGFGNQTQNLMAAIKGANAFKKGAAKTGALTSANASGTDDSGNK